MTAPPVWSVEQLEEARAAAIEVFRRRRMQEPLAQYLQAFDAYKQVVEGLLATTGNLSALDDQLIAVVTDARLLEALRYVPGPPVSTDDLKTLADAVLTPSRLRASPDKAREVARIILNGLDRRRFPWVAQGREPTTGEREAAVLASAALLATQRVGTSRRNDGKDEQEKAVMRALEEAGLRRVAARPIPTLEAAPGRGEFCGESTLGSRKADIVLRLWDGRVMPIECKVSNSSTNSVKRLNNDAAVKAVSWVNDFGTLQVVPAAVLGGVYKLHNLQEAQQRGLALFWAHDLGALTAWIDSTRPAAPPTAPRTRRRPGAATG